MSDNKTDCEQCKGWYNSCAPDDFPEYISDPCHCSMFERVDTPPPLPTPTPTHETAEDLTGEGLKLKLEDDDE